MVVLCRWVIMSCLFIFELVLKIFVIVKFCWLGKWFNGVNWFVFVIIKCILLFMVIFKLCVRRCLRKSWYLFVCKVVIWFVIRCCLIGLFCCGLILINKFVVSCEVFCIIVLLCINGFGGCWVDNVVIKFGGVVLRVVLFVVLVIIVWGNILRMCDLSCVLKLFIIDKIVISDIILIVIFVVDI